MDDQQQIDTAEAIAQARARVVTIAHEWLRTPYVHQARIKGVGADCTFIAKVYEEAGIVPAVDIPPYSHHAHLSKQAAEYLRLVVVHAKREIPQAEALPGDLVLFEIGRVFPSFSHSGIIVEPGWPQIIHAEINAKIVTLGLGDAGPLAGANALKFFTMW